MSVESLLYGSHDGERTLDSMTFDVLFLGKLLIKIMGYYERLWDVIFWSVSVWSFSD